MTWRCYVRRHHDGTLGLVIQDETLSTQFAAGAGSGITINTDREFNSYADARAHADRRAAETGHVCDARCGQWAGSI